MYRLKQLFREQAGEHGGDGGGAPNGGEDGGNQGGGSELTLEQLQRDNQSMKAKMEELLGETKRAKQLRREAEEAANRQTEEEARKAGNFEQLFKSAEQKNKALEDELNSLRGNMENEKKNNTVTKLAAELADGHNAENLALLIQNRVKYVDGDIKVLDNNGDLTVSTLDDLKTEIKSTPRFQSLLRGSQASGSGATGNRASGTEGKTVSRSDWNSWSHSKRSKFHSDGGKVID